MKTMKIGIKFFITILFLSFFVRATECKAEETLRYDDLKIMKKVCIYVDISGSVKSMESTGNIFFPCCTTISINRIG